MKGFGKRILLGFVLMSLMSLGMAMAVFADDVQNYTCETLEDGTQVVKPATDDAHSSDDYYEDEQDVEVAGDEDTPLTAGINKPGKPVWTDYDKGEVTFDFNDSDKNIFYFAELQRDGERVTTYHMGQVRKRITDDTSHSFHLTHCMNETGDYRWRVKAGKNDNDYDFEKGAVSDWSEVFSYVRPENELGKAKNLRWSDEEPGTALWDAVDGAYEYEVRLYKDDRSIGGYFGSYHNGLKQNFLSKIGDPTDGSYTFTVHAISDHITTVANGRESRRSAALGSEDVSKKDDIEDTSKKLSEAEDQTAAEEELSKMLNSDDFDMKQYQLALQADEATRNAVDSLESDYKEKANVNVKAPEVSDDAEIHGQVTIRGAALNALAGDTVGFNVKRADESDNRVIDTSVYKNVTRFDMDIAGAGRYDPETGELAFPVEITMPVPDYIQNRLTAVILHYRHNKNESEYDLIHPRFNSDGTMSFTVTHFSEIAVAEPAAPEIVVGQKYDITTRFEKKCGKYEVTKDTKSFASVDKKGLVAGKKAGKAVVVGYVSAGKNKWKEAERVEINVSLPVFEAKNKELTKPEEQFDAAANLKNCAASVAHWRSNKPSIAEVDSNGLVTAKSKGSAKIIAVFGTEKGKLKEYSFTVKVNTPVQSKVSGKLLTGGTLNLKLSNTKKNITWNSDPNGLASVDNKGKVTLINAGNAVITANVEGIDTPYSWSFTIEEPKVKGSSSISLSLKKKKTATLGLTNTKYKPAEIKWIVSEGSDPDVVVIGTNGKITANKVGTTEIYTETGGVKNTYQITVTE